MSIRAGVGERLIAVPENSLLFGHPGLRRVCSGTADPLRVTALHLRTGVHGALFLAVDLYGLETYLWDRIAHEIAQATGIPAPRMFLGCTHTHSGPTPVWSFAWKDDRCVPAPDSFFLDAVAQAAVAAAAEACATTRPVETGTATAHHADPLERTDLETPLLAFRDETGQGVALLVLGAIPPALIWPGCDRVSADYPAFVRERLAERRATSVPLLFYTKPSAGIPCPHAAQDDPFALARRFGYALADAAAQALDRMRWTRFDNCTEISFFEKSETLALRPVPDVAAADDPSATDLTERTERRIHAQGVAHLAQQREQGLLERMAPIYSVATARQVRLGDTTLAGLSGNVAPAHAQAWEKTLPGRVLVAGHVHGFLQGDIMDEEREAAGEFGHMPSPFSCSGILRLTAPQA
jgi:hypothetical protein